MDPSLNFTPTPTSILHPTSTQPLPILFDICSVSLILIWATVAFHPTQLRVDCQYWLCKFEEGRQSEEIWQLQLPVIDYNQKAFARTCDSTRRDCVCYFVIIDSGCDSKGTVTYLIRVPKGIFDGSFVMQMRDSFNWLKLTASILIEKKLFIDIINSWKHSIYSDNVMGYDSYSCVHCQRDTSEQDNTNNKIDAQGFTWWIHFICATWLN